MARGNIGRKRKTKNKVVLQTNGSDESDEDYRVDEDEEEFDVSEDDCSFAEDESEESLGLEEEEEEDEWSYKKVKKVAKTGGRKGCQVRKKNRVTKRRKKKVVCSTEEEDYDDEGDEDYAYGAKRQRKNKVSYKEEDDDEPEAHHGQDVDEFDGNFKNQQFSCGKENFEDSHKGNPREKDDLSYEEEKEDDDGDDSYEVDDEDDDEFTPSQVLKRTKRNNAHKQVLGRKKSKVSNEVKDENPISQKKKTNMGGWVWGRRGKRKLNVNSDSDFVSSGSSDYEYTVSEEEREQVKEAGKFCTRLTTRPRSSRPLKNVKNEEKMPSKAKRLGKKGKQKEVETKIEVGKQVCGICLSEEGKKTVRGVLNCCSHYFCFACIMEWSKVESRCPLCKQRFGTISRTARGEGGRDLRGAVFPVPERDQVYQPSEEELRGYLDPYENVLCTECLLGGDDALMLLCDLCDSPAHTYCVGLGREVPDGNWYCDGCRPTALASSNSQALNSFPDYGANNNVSAASSPATAVRETFDLNEAYVPDTPLSQESGHHQSPRNFFGHFQSPFSGSGAFTLLERRRIQRQIHQFLNNRQRQYDRSVDAAAPVPSINLFGSPITPARTVPQNMYVRERSTDYNSPPSVFSPRLSRLRGEPFCNQASTSTEQSSGGLLLNEFNGINGRIGSSLGHSQILPCSGASNSGPTSSTPPYQFREAAVPSRTLQPNP
ncbi:uncharacterized protein LOC127262174 isoform X3 [Andrographis paniculata]|nr:uncharacterized protein LOC127262174 isoform X3 [Andrographis paniculata]XP_051146677.1 uncharacterized protein LOC127262174 isoform X3 [Andrographis paniculata]XP_051146678.1 uncharacterized protein LOC127262174 isoform X3 [Andrographis paniculata]